MLKNVLYLTIYYIDINIILLLKRDNYNIFIKMILIIEILENI